MIWIVCIRFFYQCCGKKFFDISTCFLLVFTYVIIKIARIKLFFVLFLLSFGVVELSVFRSLYLFHRACICISVCRNLSNRDCKSFDLYFGFPSDSNLSSDLSLLI